MTTRFLSFLVSCLSCHSANLPDFSSKYPHLYIHNFQGMYPPQEPVTSDIGGLGWQPIPVHTLPRSKDLVVVSNHNCPRWRQIWKQKLKELVSTREIFANTYVDAMHYWATRFALLALLARTLGSFVC